MSTVTVAECKVELRQANVLWSGCVAVCFQGRREQWSSLKPKEVQISLRHFSVRKECPLLASMGMYLCRIHQVISSS